MLDCILIITSVVPPDLPMQLALAVNQSLLALQKTRRPSRVHPQRPGGFRSRPDPACIACRGSSHFLHGAVPHPVRGQD